MRLCRKRLSLVKHSANPPPGLPSAAAEPACPACFQWHAREPLRRVPHCAASSPASQSPDTQSVRGRFPSNVRCAGPKCKMIRESMLTHFISADSCPLAQRCRHQEMSGHGVKLQLFTSGIGEQGRQALPGQQEQAVDVVLRRSSFRLRIQRWRVRL